MQRSNLRWAGAIVAAGIALGMLSFYQTTGAAPKDVRQPFNNSVQQRQEMIRELQEIKALLKEQNALLRASVSQEPGQR